MAGLHFRTGRSLRLIGTLLEGSALIAGWLLGGRVGVGTVAFAMLVGPAVQAAVHALGGLQPIANVRDDRRVDDVDQLERARG